VFNVRETAASTKEWLSKLVAVGDREDWKCNTCSVLKFKEISSKEIPHTFVAQLAPL
jgi:hypothetical protein